MQNTITDYKELIYKELESIPIGTYPRLYDIIKNLSQELRPKKTKNKESKLKGLWGKIEVSDDLINEAKNSLFKGREV